MTRHSPEERPERPSADDIARRVRHERRMTWAGRALMTAGLLVAAQHLVAHAGVRLIPVGMGTQDLAIGYPTAMVLVIAGLMIWGRKPTPS